MGQAWDKSQEDAVAALAVTAKAEANPFLVVVDAGHGGMDGGTQGYGLLEKTVVIDLANRLEKHLKEQGCRVLMTRRDDTLMELGDRSAVANQAKADAFVSVHLNADPHSKDTAGVETYYSSRKKLGDGAKWRTRLGMKHDIPIRDERSPWLARMVQQRLCHLTGANDRKVRDSEFIVVMEAECPAVLVECGYLTNEAEALCFTNEGYKNSVVVAIGDAVLRFLHAIRMNPRRGLEFVPPTEAPSPPGVTAPEPVPTTVEEPESN